MKLMTLALASVFALSSTFALATTTQNKNKSSVKTHTAAQSKNYSRYSGSYGQYKGSYGRNYGSSNSNGGLVGGADPGTYKP